MNKEETRKLLNWYFDLGYTPKKLFNELFKPFYKTIIKEEDKEEIKQFYKEYKNLKEV